RRSLDRRSSPDGLFARPRHRARRWLFRRQSDDRRRSVQHRPARHHRRRDGRDAALDRRQTGLAHRGAQGMTMRICTPTLALCCPILLALAGCKAGPDDPSGEDTDGIAVDDDADDDAPNDDSDDDDEPPPPDAKGRCESSVVGPPLMRRLTRAEFENTIRAAFPTLGGNSGAVAVGPDPLSNLGFSNGAATLEVGKQTANEI